MNGSENSYAIALFFALISFGALLKIDDIIIGGGVGVVGALLAAVSLRQALSKSAQAVEEDHQRMEIQFQQLRSKIIETSETNIVAMNSLNDVTQLLQKNLRQLQENLKLMGNKQTELDNFTQLIKNTESINSLVASLEENSSSLNVELEKISIAIQSQEKPSDATSELKNLIAVEKTNVANIQTALKILHAIAQMIRNTSYDRGIEKINASLEKLSTRAENSDVIKNSVVEVLNEITVSLDELRNSADDSQKNLSELVKINATLSKNFTTTLDDLRLDMAKLSAKFEALKDSSRKSRRANRE